MFFLIVLFFFVVVFPSCTKARSNGTGGLLCNIREKKESYQNFSQKIPL
jgi:hypothetical protein